MFSLTTIICICALFFDVLILFVHGTYLGIKTYKAQQKKNHDKQLNIAKLLQDITSADEKVSGEAQKKLTQLLIADKFNNMKGTI